MIRASLVVASFILSLYSCTSLFGLANGFVVACIVTGVVAFAAEGLWPPRRRNPVRIEPRLRPISPVRFETPLLLVGDNLVQVPPFGGIVVEDCEWHAVPPPAPAVFQDVGKPDLIVHPGMAPETIETLRDLFLHEGETSPIASLERDLAREILQDLAGRVTPEMLALPIPTAVRAVLDDLREAGK